MADEASRPGTRREAALAAYAKHVNPMKLRTLAHADLAIVEGRRAGAYVEDLDGRRYLDCFTGAGSFNLGHRHPRIVAALERALDDEGLDLGNFTLLSAPKAELAARLAAVTPGDLEGVTYGVGGGEAVDFAIKLARGFTGRTKVVSTVNGYHGHTGFALSAIGRDAYQEPFRPLMPGFARVPFGDLDAAKSVVDDETAAVLVEPVQGEGGVHVAPDGYLQGLRAICDATGALLVLDEIQTGLGRTGRLFACEHAGVVPDIMTLAKSLGGGIYPISATVYRAALEDFVYMNPFVHLSTFGGADLGCVVALEVLDVLVEERIPEHAAAMGARLMAGLQALADGHGDVVREVRGLGLMVGVEYADDSYGPRMSRALAAEGVIAIFSANRPAVMRLMPPLVVTEHDVDLLLERFGRALDKVARGDLSDPSPRALPANRPGRRRSRGTRS
jgi:putrescine aminotransferase